MSVKTIEQYLALQARFDEDENIFLEAQREFFADHPDVPRPQPVECLNLIMKREYAEQILRGEKKVEIRSYSQHYIDRLYDRDVLEYERAHWDDELLRLQMLDFNDSVRAVKKIHFHNYNNSWYLDVECVENTAASVCDADVNYLREEYGCHDFDEMLSDLNRRKAKNRPLFFYFVVGEILGTNIG